MRSTWLHDILATVSRNMDRRKKRAACAARKNPDRKKRTIDLDTETLKRLMDGFYEPSELAKAGGTGAFEGDVIYGALKGDIFICYILF